MGVVRSFMRPSSRAILPQLVPEEHFPNAVAWNGTVFQGATIIGPALGGLIYAISRGPERRLRNADRGGRGAIF